MLFAVLALGFVGVGPIASAAPEPGQAGLRVLLVGNSYTRFNVLPNLVRRVGRSVPDGPPLQVEMVAKGGYTLRMHWLRSEALQRIRHRHYTHVVLQDHSLRPIDRVDEMTEYVQRFSRAIEETGADTVLYETWPRRLNAPFYATRPDLSGPDRMYSMISDVYQRLAEAHGARVAPVGTAFVEASEADPDIGLYKRDGAHPSLSGSYLAACVIYGAVSGIDPREARYVPFPMVEEEAVRLRDLAATVLRLRAQHAAGEPEPAGATHSAHDRAG